MDKQTSAETRHPPSEESLKVIVKRWYYFLEPHQERKSSLFDDVTLSETHLTGTQNAEWLMGMKRLEGGQIYTTHEQLAAIASPEVLELICETDKARLTRTLTDGQFAYEGALPTELSGTTINELQRSLIKDAALMKLLSMKAARDLCDAIIETITQNQATREKGVVSGYAKDWVQLLALYRMYKEGYQTDSTALKEWIQFQLFSSFKSRKKEDKVTVDPLNYLAAASISAVINPDQENLWLTTSTMDAQKNPKRLDQHRQQIEAMQLLGLSALHSENARLIGRLEMIRPLITLDNVTPDEIRRALAQTLLMVITNSTIEDEKVMELIQQKSTEDLEAIINYIIPNVFRQKIINRVES